jgi:uncharacterized protein YfkK (UPF0435 family)
MINIFKRFARKQKTPKISKMLLDVAGEYIAMGDNQAEKQEYLNGAVSAWNISCLESRSRENALKEYRKNYQLLNPSHTKHDCDDALDNIELLIKRKNELYPRERIQIAHAKIVTRGNKDHVTVVSVRSR